MNRRNGLLLFVLLSLAVIAGFGIFISRWTVRPAAKFDRALGIEFAGDRIVFHTTPEQFLALSYDQRADLISRQVSAVVHYVKALTGAFDIADVVSRPDSRGGAEFRIGMDPNSDLIQIMACNYAFSTNIRCHPNQAAFFRKMLTDLNRATGFDFKLEDFLDRACGFSDTDFMQADLSDGAKRYIARAMIIRVISRAIIGDGKHSAREKLERLMDWTFINVSNHFTRVIDGYEEFVDFNDIPLELMLRGMGDCDRSAWVLSRLAHHAGLEGHVVYLHRPGMEGRASFHTIAEIRTDRGWVAVDPFNDLIHEKGVVELSRDTDYFKHSWIFINSSPAQAFLPVMRLAEMICRIYVPDQRLFRDVRQATASYLADCYGSSVSPDKTMKLLQCMTGSHACRPASDEVSLTRWEFPFWMRGYYFQNAYLIYKYRKLPFLEKLRASEKFRDMPVAIVSVSGSQEKVRRAFELNVVEYLVKSQYKVSDLAQRVIALVK